MMSVMHITDNAGKTKRILQYSPFGNVYKFEKTIDIEMTLISFYRLWVWGKPKSKVGRFAKEGSNKGKFGLLCVLL